MTTKERIEAELERLSSEQLEELYHYIQQSFHGAEQSQGLFARLKTIQLDGPVDLAEHFDRYAEGGGV